MINSGCKLLDSRISKELITKMGQKYIRCATHLLYCNTKDGIGGSIMNECWEINFCFMGSVEIHTGEQKVATGLSRFAVLSMLTLALGWPLFELLSHP